MLQLALYCRCAPAAHVAQQEPVGIQHSIHGFMPMRVHLRGMHFVPQIPAMQSCVIGRIAGAKHDGRFSWFSVTAATATAIHGCYSWQLNSTGACHLMASALCGAQQHISFCLCEMA